MILIKIAGIKNFQKKKNKREKSRIFQEYMIRAQEEIIELTIFLNCIYDVCEIILKLVSIKI